MAKFITQLRHGTTSDWLKSTVIPAKNELIVEYCDNGKKRFKLGNGQSKFEDLPYIDGELESAINTLRNQVSNIVGSGSDTAVTELEIRDMRVGYDEAEYDTAGEHIRAVGKETADLKASLKQFIDAAAVDGLLYENNLLYLTAGGVIVSDPVEVKGGSGGGDSSNVILKISNNNGASSLSAANGSPVVLKFTFTSEEDGAPTGDFACSISVAGKVVKTLNLKQGAQVIDVSDLLKAGSNTVRVTCSDIYGNSRSLAYTCTVIDLRISSTFDSSRPFDDAIIFQYVPTGEIDKTVHFLIDGKEVAYKNVSASGRSMTQELPLQSHGSHSLDVYITATLNDQTITSNHLVYDIMCVEAGVETPLIASVYPTTEIKQGNIISIPYCVYVPGKDSADITLSIYEMISGEEKAYGTPIELNVDRSLHYWNVRQYPTGTVRFKITYTDEKYTVSKTHTILVEKSDIDIDPVTASLALQLSAVGRSNDERPSPAHWTYNDITTTFNNFNWVSNGWVVDENLDTCLRLNGDANIDIDYKLFDRDFREMGKTIELEFAIRDVNDREAVVIDCTDGNIGLQVTADTATLSGTGAKVNCTYRENEHIRVSFTVGMVNNGTRFICTYIDGILSNIAQYPENGNFEQTTAKTIHIGSELCGIDIYNIRVYDYELSSDEIVQNYIADTTLPVLKQELFEDNDIFEDGKVSYDKVKTKIPTVLFIGSMPTFKGDKKKNSVTMVFIHPDHPELNFTELLKEIDVQGTSSQFYVRKNWKTKHNVEHQHMVDQVPAKVFCLKVDYAEATGTHNTQVANFAETLYSEKIPPQAIEPRVRTTIAGFPCVIFEQETADSEPVFSSKANFNFDKGAENAFGFSSAFDTECWEFCNNTSNSCNFLGEIPDDWKDDFEPRYTGKTTTVINDEGEEEQVNCWDRIEELREKQKALAQDGKALSEAELSELAELNRDTIARFKEMHDWVLSTATVAPVETQDDDGNVVLGGVTDIDFTNAADLPEPVIYGGKTYYKDNKEYRLAKFEYEFENYFNMHYSTVYYVFTFFALMTDQRAKNMFLTYWETNGQGRWYPYLYDNDTSFGINNEGARVFDYYHEDTDKIGTSNVYNGQNSILWNNFRVCFPQRIAAMYASLRSDKKITYDKLVDRFITQGAEQWSASLYNEDAEYKYITMARPENADPEKGVDTANLYQVKGSAEHHFKYFVENRIMYCDSKWNCGDYPSDYAFLRIYTPQVVGGNTPKYTSTKNDDGTIEITSNWLINNGTEDVDTGLAVTFDEDNAIIAPEIVDKIWHINGVSTNIEVLGDPLVVTPDPSITVKTFSSMYAGVKYKANGTFQSQKLMAGESHKFSPPNPKEIFNDTETGIYGASEISSLGDLSPLYCGVINVSSCKKLTDLIIGNHTSGYKNDNFRELSIGSNKLLKKIDVTNCTGLGLDHGNGTPQLTLDVSNCPNIEEIYAEGTNLQNIQLPDSGYLRVLHAPSTLTSLTIKNQIYLTDETSEEHPVPNLKIDDWSKIKQLFIENCPGLDTRRLLENCRDDEGNWTVDRVRLTDVDWTVPDVTFLKSLYSVKGSDKLNVNTDHAYLTGKCYIETLTGEEMAEINSIYPYLEISFGTLTAKLTLKDLAGGTYEVQEITCSNNVGGTGTCPITAGRIPTPTRTGNEQYTYTWGGWSRSLDGDPDPDALLNIRADRTVYVAFVKTVKQYDVDFYNDNILLATVSTPYGGDAAYPGEDPEKLDTAYPELYDFRSWYPEPVNITGPLKCYAQFQIVEEGGWHTLGLADFDKSVDSTNKTLSITAYNAVHPLVKVPETFTVESASYSTTSVAGFNQSVVELVDLPNTLQTISANTFSDCTKLSEIDIPTSVNYIGSRAFYNCTTLDKVNYNAVEATAGTYNGYISQGPFNGCVSSKGFVVRIGNKVEVIPASMFSQGNTNENTVIRIEFEDTPVCAEIGEYAFARVSLEKLELPSSIKKIKSYAFRNNSKITELVLPEGLTTLGDSVFVEWKRLKKVTIPSTVSSIGSSLFASCPELETIIVDSNNAQYVSIDNCLIDKVSKQLIQGCKTSIIPESVTSFDSSAFKGCTNLMSVVVPSTVSEIPSECFYECTNLTSIAFRGNVTNIRAQAFYSCYNLDINLPDSVTSIGTNAFSYNKVTETLTMPSKLTNIGAKAFSSCEKLTTVDFRNVEDLPTISDDAFASCAALTEIIVPWEENKVVGAPWGATNATIKYNS